MIKTINIFSLFVNISKVMTKRKYSNIDAVAFAGWFAKQKQYIVSKCEDIACHINSGHYSYHDVKMYMLHLYLYGDDVKWSDLSNTNVSRYVNSGDSLDKDKSVMIEISKRLGISNLNDYYKVNVDGKSLIYELIINKNVSSWFYLNMKRYITKLSFDDESDEHRFFRFVMDVIDYEQNKQK